MCHDGKLQKINYAVSAGLRKLTSAVRLLERRTWNCNSNHHIPRAAFCRNLMAKGGAGQRREGTCCGVIHEAKYQARAKQDQRTAPQPWIVLKLTIAVGLGIIGYACYVYIGRFCLPMIRKSGGALGGRVMGSEWISGSPPSLCSN